jgi:hypothetical protein
MARAGLAPGAERAVDMRPAASELRFDLYSFATTN